MCDGGGRGVAGRAGPHVLQCQASREKQTGEPSDRDLSATNAETEMKTAGLWCSWVRRGARGGVVTLWERLA